MMTFLPRVDQFGGGDQPGKAGADNDHVRIIGHARASRDGEIIR